MDHWVVEVIYYIAASLLLLMWMVELCIMQFDPFHINICVSERTENMLRFHVSLWISSVFLSPVAHSLISNLYLAAQLDPWLRQGLVQTGDLMFGYIMVHGIWREWHIRFVVCLQHVNKFFLYCGGSTR